MLRGWSYRNGLGRANKAMINLIVKRIRRASPSRRCPQFCSAMPLLLWSALCFVGASAQISQSPPITPVAPSVLSAPVTLEQQPPSEPAVVFENGLLTITATNSTLHDVLQAIQDKTGAEIDIPSQVEERVATHVGPGLPHEVIQSLLTGSNFNYVLIGSNANPKALTRVLLFLKPPPEHSSQSVTIASAVSKQNNTAEEFVEPAGAGSEPVLPARFQQQMLQQRRQMVMEQLRQNAQSR